MSTSTDTTDTREGAPEYTVGVRAERLVFEDVTIVSDGVEIRNAKIYVGCKP